MRNNQRQSYIITSTPFQNAIKTKIDQKIAIEQGKTDRKNERLEKKMLKEQSKENNHKQKIAIPKKRPIAKPNPKIISDKIPIKKTRINSKIQGRFIGH